MSAETRGGGFPQSAPAGQEIVAETTVGGRGWGEVKHKKGKYRGRGKYNRKNRTFSILLANIRGYKSKEVSVKKLIKKVKPSMVLLNETLLAGNTKVTITPYNIWSKNRKEKGGGGILTAVAQEYKDSTVGVGEGEGEDEYLVTRIESFSPALNIINCYGEQRKTNKQEVEAKWGRLCREMEEIRRRKEFVCLAGDLNKLVGIGELGVPGNHKEISFGGRLLREQLQTGNWFLVNGMGQEIVSGGPFTRKDPASGNMSCLDMFVVSAELLPYVQSLVIDSKREMAVTRAVKVGTRYKAVPSDHFTCILTLTDLPRVQERKGENQVVWNLKKEGGWNKYQLLTDKYSDYLEQVISDKNTNIEEKYSKFEKVHDKIKYKAFGKVTISDRKNNKYDEEKAVTSNKTNAKELFEEQQKKADEAIKEIKNKKLSRVGNIWEVRKKVLGKRKENTRPNAILNPENGKLVVSNQNIKTVTLKYCQETLQNNEPHKQYFEEIKMKTKEVEKKLFKENSDFDISKETFDSIITKFRKSGKKNYSFLVKAGNRFQSAVFRFCQLMFEKEVFPETFNNTTLHMIFKGGKGRREKLTDNRFIHSKNWFPRLAEALCVEEGMKWPLIDQSSMYQIGGQPGHR